MSRRIGVLLICGLLAVLSGCPGSTDRGDDEADGAAPPWTIREITTIGAVAGDEAYEFSRIGTVDVDRAGNIYVLDVGLRRVRKFSESGRFLAEMGADGGGPGEFSPGPNAALSVGGMALVGDSMLVVHDPWDWTLALFDRAGESLDDVRLLVPPPAPFYTRRSLRLADLGNGWIVIHFARWYGSGAARSASDGEHTLVRVALDGTRSDTLLTFRHDDVIFRSLDERRGELFGKPFPARWSWDVGPSGQIAVGQGGRYEITVHDREGRIAGRLRRVVDAPPVSRADVSRFRSRFPFGGGMRDLTPEERRVASQVLDELEFPATWPFFDDLKYDRAGRLWVRRHPVRDDDEAEWDIFDNGLGYLGSARLPRVLTVHRITDDRIYGTVRDSNDVDFVKVFALVPRVTETARTPARPPSATGAAGARRAPGPR